VCVCVHVSMKVKKMHDDSCQKVGVCPCKARVCFLCMYVGMNVCLSF
jgi:hypothetical protein